MSKPGDPRTTLASGDVVRPDSVVRSATQTLSEDGFSAELAWGTSGAVVSLRGALMSPTPGALLKPFLDEVHDAVRARGCRSVEVDMARLEHLGPGALGAFLRWTDAVRALPRRDRYEIVFLCAPERRWQRTGLLAIQCSAADFVKLRHP